MPRGLGGAGNRDERIVVTAAALKRKEDSHGALLRSEINTR